jgi:glycosyltransferase involved in cell wall biosynthesis
LYDRKLVAYLRSQGDSVQVLSLPSRPYRAHLMDNLRVPAWNADDYDVVLQDELCHPSLIRWNKAQAGNTKLISIVHHLRSSERWGDWDGRLYRKIERDYLATVDAFVFNSQTTRDTVRTLLEREIVGVVATPGGDRFSPAISTQHIIARAHESGPLRLVFVGAVTPRKNLHTLFRALGYMKEGVSIDIAGSQAADPDYVTALKKQLDELGIQKLVRWHGEIDDAELELLLRRSQLNVGVSEYEGFGIAYLEAMSFGVPVLASTAGAAGEIVDDGRNGLLADPDDAHDIERKVLSLMRDRYKLAALSLAALTRYTEMPTWDETGAEIRKFIDRFARVQPREGRQLAARNWDEMKKRS